MKTYSVELADDQVLSWSSPRTRTPNSQMLIVSFGATAPASLMTA